MHAHGLEGSVTRADDKTFVVVVEGDVEAIRKLYNDVHAALADNVKLSDIVLSKTDPPRDVVEDPLRQVIDSVQRMEQRIIRIENKLNAILARLESGGFNGGSDESYREYGSGEISEESTNAFASMFGD
ncbi:MAG: hypothetical protein ABIH11_00890 [Candidatus Altiarchaeota archaeon]